MDLYVEDLGSGDPVVLAHAGVTDSRVWDQSVPALLAAGYRVIRYDAPGYGRSPVPTAPYSLVDVALEVLDAAAVKDVHWVGLSMGGATGADLAIAAPDRVRTLSLVAPGLSGYEWPVYTPPIEDVIGILRRWGPMSFDAQGKVIDEPASRVLLEQKDWFESEIDLEVEPPSALDRLAGIAVPTLIVLGDRDESTITEIGHLYAAGIPGSRLITLAGADHLLPLRVPGELNRLLLEHFASPAPTRPS